MQEISLFDRKIRDLSYKFVRNGSYTLTISPPKPEAYTNKWYWDIIGPIRNMLELAVDWILIPEFSDEGRLHWHGCMKFKNKDMFTQWKVVCGRTMKKYGSISIQRIIGIKWINYIMKDFVKTRSNEIFGGGDIIESKHELMHFFFFNRREDYDFIDKSDEPERLEEKLERLDIQPLLDFLDAKDNMP